MATAVLGLCLVHAAVAARSDEAPPLYLRTTVDIVLVVAGMAFAMVGTGIFVAYVSITSSRRTKALTTAASTQSTHGDSGAHANDMPLLSDLDLYHVDPRNDVAPLYPHQLLRRETPLLERCGSSTVSDYQMANETELKPLTFEVETQRFNVQMRSAHPIQTADRRFNIKLKD
ncbi:hypothetical protein H257_03166 [Aphanomyces astaci]|uniref:Uncharacterized protein n=1 Tax=Aphanomyces astaci TaxID=112090 RepID=W4H0I5_APHAT|nr:hypothetical protein H257_03166 [Aphanomyces astaci]ETV85427.1 hypothetical protein H257_03166 [Aphanomyces astaci]|eukprot:XP_009825445.1 hypothetical protein H257_03166 [Aphanomyces astaci]